MRYLAGCCFCATLSLQESLKLRPGARQRHLAERWTESRRGLAAQSLGLRRGPKRRGRSPQEPEIVCVEAFFATHFQRDIMFLKRL